MPNRPLTGPTIPTKASSRREEREHGRRQVGSPSASEIAALAQSYAVPYRVRTVISADSTARRSSTVISDSMRTHRACSIATNGDAIKDIAAPPPATLTIDSEHQLD